MRLWVCGDTASPGPTRPFGPRYQNLIASNHLQLTQLLRHPSVVCGRDSEVSVVVTLHTSKSRLPNPRTWLCLWSSLRLTCMARWVLAEARGKASPTKSTGASHPCGTYALQLFTSSPVVQGCIPQRTVWSGQLDAFSHHLQGCRRRPLHSNAFLPCS